MTVGLAALALLSECLQSSVDELHSAPRVIRDSDLMDIVGIKHSQFYKRKARGDFRFLELTQQLPESNTFYSPTRVAAWLRGERPVETRYFPHAKQPRVSKRSGRPRNADMRLVKSRMQPSMQDAAPAAPESAGESVDLGHGDAQSDGGSR